MIMTQETPTGLTSLKVLVYQFNQLAKRQAELIDEMDDMEREMYDAQETMQKAADGLGLVVHFNRDGQAEILQRV
jgi:uncharacterized protein YhaN